MNEQTLRAIFVRIRDGIKSMGMGYGFLALFYPYGKEVVGHAQYISSGDRRDCIRLLYELVAKIDVCSPHLTQDEGAATPEEIDLMNNLVVYSLNSEKVSGYGFIWVLFDYGEGGSMHFFSTAKTEDMIHIIDTTRNRLEERM